MDDKEALDRIQTILSVATTDAWAYNAIVAVVELTGRKVD